MGLNYYASSSPVLTLNPDSQHQASYFGAHYQDTAANTASSAGATPFAPSSAEHMAETEASAVPQTTSMDMSTTTTTTRKPVRPRFPRPPSINYLATSSSISGRKRSIADVHDDEPHVDLDGSLVTPQSEVPPSPPKPRGEPVLGPGMTLVYPDDPQYSALQAESQTGTWHEEKAVEVEQSSTRPAISSRKSQRREVPDAIAIDPMSSLPSDAMPAVTSSPPSASSPVDKLGVILGVGWKRISPNLAPAAKGWEKYILNHYSSIEDPCILLYNEGLHAYLVRAMSASNDTQQCWWVFQEDLSACRLVGHCEEDAIRSLQSGESIAMGPVVHAHKQSYHRSVPSVNTPIVSMDEPFATTAVATPPTTAALEGANDVEMEM